MAEAERVDLAHEPDFVLGRLTVSPVRRELARDDGEREVVEHKVMQVLIALARAQGAVVTRDELTHSCWEGRVIGEDAINRVLSRLRKSADGIGRGSFRIETVTKIGYRLVAPGHEAHRASAPPVSRGPGRRAFIAGAATTGIAGLALGGFALHRWTSQPALPPELENLVEQAQNAMAQGTREGQSQAIGLYRRMTEIAPQSAEGWGRLSSAYAWGAIYRPREEARMLRERSLAAARRSLELDPDNTYGALAAVLTLPIIGHWAKCEIALRRALAERPDDDGLCAMLAGVLCEVGRFSEALSLIERFKARPLSPGQYFQRMQMLWCLRRIDELERVSAEASRLYPTHFSLWFSRFYIALHDGRPAAAVVQGEDVENRPTGIPSEEFDDILAVARAAHSRDPAAIEAVMDRQMHNARTANGRAENALQFACLFGRLDAAFAIADAYYFARGFIVPDIRFSVSQGTYLTRENRNTRFLFAPSTRALRADPRFLRLTGELGLERYWRESGAPDFRKG